MPAGTVTFSRSRWPIIYLSPRGRPFDQATAVRFAATEGMTLLCGRFEGVDQRVLDHHEIEEVSLGDFVMTGGEIAASSGELSESDAEFIERVGTGMGLPSEAVYDIVLAKMSQQSAA